MRGVIGQSVKCWTCKQEDHRAVSLHQKKLSMVNMCLESGAWGKQRQADTWGSVVSHFSLLGEFQVGVRGKIQEDRAQGIAPMVVQ